MSSSKTLLIAWLCGIAAGLVLMERWRRMGGGAVPVVAVVAEPSTLTPPPTGVGRVKGFVGDRFAAPIVTGAKADLAVVQRRFRRDDHTAA